MRRRGSDDFAQYHTVRDDFYNVLRRTRVKDDVIDAKFRDAYARLKSLGFFQLEEDSATGQVRVWIATQ